MDSSIPANGQKMIEEQIGQGWESNLGPTEW